MLKEVFGVVSHSIYDDKLDIGANEAFSSLVGHVSHGNDMASFHDLAAASETIMYVKTHTLPSDDNKAIYVVRDGRAAIVSYWHYRNEIANSPCTLEEVVLGDDFAGLWSEHVRAWAQTDRPNTLVVRYEDLASGTPSTLDAISRFLELPQVADFAVDFQKLRRTAPTFFRAGSNAINVAELDAACPQLFHALHGRTMASLGYRAETLALDSRALAAEIKQIAAPVAVCSPAPHHRKIWFPIEGFGHVEQPQPDFDLNKPFRWSVGESCSVLVAIEQPSHLRIIVRGSIVDQKLTIEWDSGREDFTLPGTLQKPITLTPETVFQPGQLTLRFSVDRCIVAHDRTVSIILENIETVPAPHSELWAPVIEE